MTMIHFKASGGEILEVEQEVAIESRLVQGAVEEGIADGFITAHNVTAHTLSTIMVYCRKHTVDKPATKEELDAWNEEFLNLFDTRYLSELVVAANYLEVDGLRDLILDKVALMITGKSPEDIRELLHIENDFTPAEEKAIKDKYPWAFQYRKVEVPADGSGPSSRSVASSSSRGAASSSGT